MQTNLLSQDISMDTTLASKLGNFLPKRIERILINNDSTKVSFADNAQSLLERGDTISAITNLLALCELLAHNAEFGKAYDNYWEALLLADMIDNEGGRAAVYHGLGLLYSLYQRQDISLEYFNKSLSILKDLNERKEVDEQAIRVTYFAILTIYRKNRDIEMSKRYVDSCLTINRVTQNPTHLDAEQAYIKFYEGHTIEALNELNRIKPYFEDRFKPYLVVLYSFLGDIHKELGKNDSSEFYYKSAITISEKYKSHLDLIPELYINLAKLNVSMNNHHDAYLHSEAARKLGEEYFGVRSKTNQSTLEIKDEFRRIKEAQDQELQKQRLAQLEHEQEISYLNSVVQLGAIFLLILVGFVIYRYIRIKHKAEKKLLQQQRVLEIQKSNEVLEVKNKELTASALLVIEREEILTEVKNKIEKLGEKPDQGDLKRLTRSINFNTSDNWREFETRFIAVNKNFYDRLMTKFPNLSKSDLRLCALVKLNFSSKDMSKLLGITLDSINTSRYRLRQKLGLEKNGNLSDFISKI
ncbi:MAG: tetratricopeptide repeat protein [Cyclobacteriaceae bacterium]